MSARVDAGATIPFVVRVRAVLQKQSGTFPYGWHARHMLVAGNFLLEFANGSDLHPRKVVLLDRAVVTPFEDKKFPHAFLVTTVAQRKLKLATDTAKLRDEFIAAIQAATYDSIVQKSINAQRFISVCWDLMNEEEEQEEHADGDAGGPAAASAAGAAESKAAGSLVVPAFSAQDALDQVVAWKEERVRLRNEMEHIRQDMASMPEDSAVMSATVTAARDEMVARLRERVAALEDDVDAGETRRRQLQGDVERQQGEKEAIITRTEAAEAEAQRLREALAARAASSEGSAAAASASESTSRVAELERQVRELTTQLDGARRRGDRLSREAEDAAEGRREAEAALAEQKSAAASLHNRLIQTRASRAALDAQLKEVRADARGAGVAASVAESMRNPPSTSPAARAASAAGDDTVSDVLPQVGSFRPSKNLPSHSGGDAGAGPSPADAAGSAMSAATSSAGGDTSESKSQTLGGEGAPDAYRHEWSSHFRDAQALEQAGRYAEAEIQYLHVYEIRKRRSGPRSVAVASAARNVGRVLAMQRKFGPAHDKYQEAVDISSDMLGPSHANTACALTDLAAILREQGRFREAVERAKQAVNALRESVGPDDVSTATALYNLAGLAKRLGEYDQAQGYYEEALGVFRLKLGEGQGETADTLYQLGSLFRRKKDYKAAMTSFNSAARAYAIAYGEDDRRVTESMSRSKRMIAAMTSSAS